MNTAQAAKLTGIPSELLIRMRARETKSLKSGPPYAKTLNPEGAVAYTYSKADVERWMKMRRCAITAADAAVVLGCSRDEILAIYGLQSIPIKNKGYEGKLLIDNGKSIYIWLPTREES